VRGHPARCSVADALAWIERLKPEPGYAVLTDTQAG
jgi:hypothetical protein